MDKTLRITSSHLKLSRVSISCHLRHFYQNTEQMGAMGHTQLSSTLLTAAESLDDTAGFLRTR